MRVNLSFPGFSEKNVPPFRIVELVPAPAMVIALVTLNADTHVAVPGGIWTVSPSVAETIAAATSEEAGLAAFIVAPRAATTQNANVRQRMALEKL